MLILNQAAGFVKLYDKVIPLVDRFQRIGVLSSRGKEETAVGETSCSMRYTEVASRRNQTSSGLKSIKDVAI